MGSYVPSTQSNKQFMLKTIGLHSEEELFANIPQNLRLTNLAIPEQKAEDEVQRIISQMAEKNTRYRSLFRGAGAYWRYIPAIVKQVVSKEEFLTAYTPYQAEISQGILQSIFEFQTMISELTGLPSANASVYDGASAAAEAVNMCLDRKHKKILLATSAHPMVQEVIRTYCHAMDTEVCDIPTSDGRVDQLALKQLIDQETAGIYIEQVNYWGQIEDCRAIADLVHQSNRATKVVMGIDPIACALLPSAAECDADIAVGEGQSLGLPLSFGGPYLGFMAAKESLTRKLPGRIVGQTEDSRGQRVFVLTLQAREQHIRREKASSNICSNQAHCALTASVYLSTIGSQGLMEVASESYRRAHYLADQLKKIEGFRLVHSGDFFNEFVMEAPVSAEKINHALAEKGILGGLPVKEGLLWCVTEMNQKADIDQLVTTIKEVCQK